MNIDRRDFVAALLIATWGCPKNSSLIPSSPTPPTTNPSTVSLLAKIQSMPEYSSAQRVSYGSNGAARIAIRGDINWNFLIGGEVIGLGPGLIVPTLDTSAITIPFDAKIVVRSL